jgi:hypothetical protein
MVQVQPGAVQEAMTERARALRGSTCNVCVTRAALVTGAVAAAFCTGWPSRLRLPSANTPQAFTSCFLPLRGQRRQPGPVF